MKHIFLFLFTFFFLGTIQNYSQGKIDKAEKSLSQKQEQNRTSSRSRSNNDDDDQYYGDSFLADSFGFILVDIFSYSSYYALVETPIEREYAGSRASITKYPYLYDQKGNYSYEQDDTTTLFRTTFSSRFVAENNKLYGNHLNLNMRFLHRFGLEVDYLQLWEENSNFGTNTLAMYTALAKYHRVRTERFDAWWGLGATYVDGEVDEWGFTYGIGAEWFFAKPFSLETNFNQTFINDNTVNKFNAFVNYHVNRYKFSAGYEHLKIGSADFSLFTAGVSISF